MIAVAEKYSVQVSMPMTITSERQHSEYVSVLDKLARQEKLTRAEDRYAQVLVTLVEAYEEQNYSIPDASPVHVLRTLMEANNLRQRDLAPLLGSESIVSEVLSGKRDLNKNHIEKLSKRFGVSPAVFFGAQR